MDAIRIQYREYIKILTRMYDLQQEGDDGGELYEYLSGVITELFDYLNDEEVERAQEYSNALYLTMISEQNRSVKVA